MPETVKNIYAISGMTCRGCEEHVKKVLGHVHGVEEVDVSLENNEVAICSVSMIPLGTLQQALGVDSRYILQDRGNGKIGQAAVKVSVNNLNDTTGEATKVTYANLYPLFLIFLFLTGTVLFLAWINQNWSLKVLMPHFMGGFFLVFSFFKFLDLKGFATSFSMYDPLAKSLKGYGLIYPFIELALGMIFLSGKFLLIACIATIIILGISSIGVFRALFKQQQIQCACLGTVLNLPMTKITLIENAVMIVMSIIMLINL